jgi:hypothetical protein
MAKLTYDLKMSVSYGWLKWRYWVAYVIDYTKLYIAFPSLLRLCVAKGYINGVLRLTVRLKDVVIESQPQ